MLLGGSWLLAGGVSAGFLIGPPLEPLPELPLVFCGRGGLPVNEIQSQLHVIGFDDPVRTAKYPQDGWHLMILLPPFPPPS